MGNPPTHRARKRFGQHFLQDQNILTRMIQAIHPVNSENLVEIGPGKGALTCPLLKQHGKLIAIELDRDLVPQLKQKCQSLGQLHLLQGDAMKIDYSTLAPANEKIRIVGNLPYNISTPVLFHLATHVHLIQDMHILLQKEVADRITATPGKKTYGRLSIMMQLTFRTVPLFDVAADAFHPPPKVQSTFVRLTPHRQALVSPDQRKKLALIVNQAFSQRRKTLRNSLQTLLDAKQICQTGIDPSRRAETLTLQEFTTLAALLLTNKSRPTTRVSQ